MTSHLHLRLAAEPGGKLTAEHLGASRGRFWEPGKALSPVRFVQLHDPLFQLTGLVWGEAELTDIVAHVFLGVIVPQLRLHGVGAQQGMRDEGAGKPACDDVRPQLQAQVVSGDRGEWPWARRPLPPRRPQAPLSTDRSIRTKLIDPQLRRKGMILHPGMSREGHLGVSDEMVLHRFI